MPSDHHSIGVWIAIAVAIGTSLVLLLTSVMAAILGRKRKRHRPGAL